MDGRDRAFTSAASRHKGLRDGPRERLHGQGPAALADAELVALLLGTGSGGRGVLQLAEDLLAPGGLRALAAASSAELRRTPGVGAAKSASLLAAVELGRRLAAQRLREGDAIRSPEDVFRHFHSSLRDAPHERFLVLLLDGRHRVIREVLTSQGTLTSSLVHPREVFRPALREGAAALVAVHNHPSGDPTPSPEDRQVTRRLIEAGKLLGVPLLDHVVVAERGFASLREAGEFDEAPGSSFGSRPRPRGGLDS
ncbi:MAG: DNA repair protein RadC [Deltaproteobacteria bacterium]|nr:DNA repair protein RadC [Deltaproteobacteria bacterium]MBW2395803.1 DNA repair protein RadC [Deltaproteobacteria bacterium]